MDDLSYASLTMADVRANEASTGLVSASFFAGCGGSSLGHRLAGYDVRYASEFIPPAADTYEANSQILVDRRDIRDVDGGEVLNRLGIDIGELDLLDGSPPCQSFSASGVGARDWGKKKLYSDGVYQRTDDLFDEYIRMVKTLMPRTFVAENVAALAGGSGIGYFRRIVASLEGIGYRVESRKVNAKHLGVPQSRTRLFIVGVREDIPGRPEWPKPQRPISTAQALPELKNPRWLLSDRSAAGKGRRNNVRPGTVEAPTVMATPRSVGGIVIWGLDMDEDKYDRPAFDSETGATLTPIDALRREFPKHNARCLDLVELRRLCGFPSDFVLQGQYEQRWERLGRAVPVLVGYQIAKMMSGVLSGARV